MSFFRSLISLVVLYLPFISVVAAADDYSCGPNKLCSIGCCGKNNVCGLGPDYCSAANCQNSCDAKSECDPGWGAQWSKSQTCPLNVCCSKYGFCGTTAEFCGTNTVTAPSSCGLSSNARTIGYYEGWSITRACDAMFPEQIPTSGYTHLNFAFAFINPSTFEVAAMSDTDVGLYKRFTGLKDSNPGLQTWISIGGWSMNDPDQPTARTFSKLAGSSDAQAKFTSSLIRFMQTYGFDGVDIDWEYPVAPERSGDPSDFTNFVTLLQNIRNAFAASGNNYGLTITIPSSYWYMQHFDIVKIEKLVDWLNVMTYDLHGTWDSTNKYIGSYVYAHTNLTEIDQTMSLLWRNNINPNKVVLGLGFYGRSYTLKDPACSSPGCPFVSGANPGECTASSGTLSFLEIQRLIKNGAKVTTNTAAAVKQVVWNNNQWVSYDDSETFKMKIDYANQHCLGGTMVWAASLDSSDGTAIDTISANTGRKTAALIAKVSTNSGLTACQFSQCGQDCPAGLSPALRADNVNAGPSKLDAGCANGQTRYYCCPPNDMPKCQFRGTAPLCRHATCADNEIEVASSVTGTGSTCWFNHKVLCCEKTTSDSNAGQCSWEGSAPSCSRGCKESDRKELTYSSFGAGGEQVCFSGYKSLCCTQPPPYSGCDWYSHTNQWIPLPGRCSEPGICPAGKQALAIDGVYCLTGASTYCCDGSVNTNDQQVVDFKNKLLSFKSNPTCPSGRGYSKRANEWNQPRDSPRDHPRDLPSNNQTHRLVKRSGESGFLTPWILSSVARAPQNYRQQLIQQTFNESYGDPLNLHGNDFLYWIGEATEESDPLTSVEELLCLGSNAQSFLGGYRSATNSGGVCELRCPRRTKRTALTPKGHLLTPKHDPLLLSPKRNLGPSGNVHTTGPDNEPSWGAVVDMLVAGHMNFLYERWILARGQQAHAQAILEIAYNLPVDPSTNQLDPIYQDHNAADSDTNPDRYFVIHLHAGHIWTDAGQPYLGVAAVTAFHGQTLRQNGMVENSATGNPRTIRTTVINCEEAANTGVTELDWWYPGHIPASALRNPSDQATQVARLGSFLRSNGLLDYRTLIDTGNGNNPNGIQAAPPGNCNDQELVWPQNRPANGAGNLRPGQGN